MLKVTAAELFSEKKSAIRAQYHHRQWLEWTNAESRITPCQLSLSNHAIYRTREMFQCFYV